MKLNAKSILILAICFILSTAITLQLRTMASEDAIASGTFGNGELRDSLLKAEERYKSMQSQLLLHRLTLCAAIPTVMQW